MPRLKVTYRQIHEKNARGIRGIRRNTPSERIQQLLHDQQEELDATLQEVNEENSYADSCADLDGETKYNLLAESNYNHAMTLYLLCLISCLLIVILFNLQHLLLQHPTQRYRK